MPKILFVTYGGGHVNMVIPVVKEVEKEGFTFTVLGLTTAGKSLEDAGLRYKTFKDYVIKYY